MAALIPHENYSPGGSRRNDILVVKTDKPFQLTQYVKIIKLAVTGNDAKGNFELKCIANQVWWTYMFVPFILQPPLELLCLQT